MPAPQRTAALALLLLPPALALSACGSGGGGTVTGIVNDTARRVCVVDADNAARSRADRTARCFDATAELLGSVAVGDCVRLDYEQRGDARLPRVTSLGQSRECPAPAEPLS